MKNKISEWLYEAWNGHPFLLSEEAEIICKTRFDENFKWMNDSQIQNLVKLKARAMYKKKYPDAKRLWIFKRFK